MHLHIKTSIKNNLKKCKAKKKKDENYYDRQHSQYPRPTAKSVYASYLYKQLSCWKLRLRFDLKRFTILSILTDILKTLYTEKKVLSLNLF